MGPPLLASHMRVALSPEVVASSLPSGEKATPLTLQSCPVNVLWTVPLSVCQVRVVQSPDVVAMRVPSGENATAWTVR